MGDQIPQRDPSMLLAFRGENVRSFREEFELSLVATRLAEPGAVRFVPWRRQGTRVGVLPVAGVFGANASGKSNLLRAMNDMRSHVLHSFRSGNPSGGVPRRRFLFDGRSATAPSRFEVEMVLRGVRYDYGFVVDDDRFLEEWAYHYPNGRAALLFRREASQVALGSGERATGRAVTRLLRPNALFLSTAASAGHPTLLTLFEWFGRNLRLADVDSRPQRQALTRGLLDHDGTRGSVLALLRAADLGVVGARKRELDPQIADRIRRASRILAGLEGDGESDEAPAFEELGVRLVHSGPEGEVEMDPEDESFGTLVWFSLVGPVIEALADGAVLLVDELDASLHPALVAELVRLFQDPGSNPNRGQLVFNSHDTTLLGDSRGDRLLGRDQVWLTEKDADGSTRLYALADLDPRREEALGRRYLAGRYGATPILASGEFDAAAALIGSGEMR